MDGNVPKKQMQSIDSADRSSNKNWRETLTKGLNVNEETVIDLVDGIFDERNKRRNKRPISSPENTGYYRTLMRTIKTRRTQAINMAYSTRLTEER